MNRGYRLERAEHRPSHLRLGESDVGHRAGGPGVSSNRRSGGVWCLALAQRTADRRSIPRTNDQKGPTANSGDQASDLQLLGSGGRI
jgi:hypothetical protein